MKDTILQIGTVHPIYGTLQMVGMLSGERYYWFSDMHGVVSMIPADSLTTLQQLTKKQ